MEGATFWSAVGAIGTCAAAVVAILAYRTSRAPQLPPARPRTPREPAEQTRRRIKAEGISMGKLKDRPNHPPGSPEGDPRLREAFENAERIFWCNTNRGGLRGHYDEQQMHEMHFAAVWTRPGLNPEEGRFSYPEHMQRVQCGDVIVMYANGLGVIGVGRATEGGVEVLGRNHPDRMRDYDTEGQNAEEWRIPVEWLVWGEDNPCPIDRPLLVSFQEITKHEQRIGLIRRHFRVGE